MDQQQFDDKYSDFYDLLYKDKNYKDEALFIDKLITGYYNQQKEIQLLDLACGTGRHLDELHNIGYVQLSGSDISGSMIKVAEERFKTQGKSVKLYNSSFQKSNEIPGEYDVVISMFSAVNYIINYQDQVLSFRNIYNLLKKGGVFIFDFWNGNAVVDHYSPVKVVRKKEGDKEIQRISETSIDTITQDVTVKFTCSLYEQEKRELEFIESHNLHYYYFPEIKNLLYQTGFSVDKICPFMNADAEVNPMDWNIAVVAKKGNK
ncbi:MAG: class I SAM-dependent methyltransferase [Cyclobacteriaceae bacterium]|nr:class I SAM-dependent methyltransferase [Cyclobacteriaceae bacterium]